MRCPYCESISLHLAARIDHRGPLEYPVAATWQCPACGYQEQAQALQRRDLRKIIAAGFDRRRNECRGEDRDIDSSP